MSLLHGKLCADPTQVERVRAINRPTRLHFNIAFYLAHLCRPGLVEDP